MTYASPFHSGHLRHLERHGRLLRPFRHAVSVKNNAEMARKRQGATFLKEIDRAVLARRVLEHVV